MPHDKIKSQIRTYGCKVNTYDTGLLQTRMVKAGIGDFADAEREVVIFNTCAVTAEATREALRDIRKLKARKPDTCVVVTGCAAQVDTNLFRDLPAADLVVANSHKGDLENLIRRHLGGELKERVFQSNIFRKEELEAGGGVESEHTRAFLKIQDGCNSFCTYCVIPFARGKSRSIDIDDLVRRVKELVVDGTQEVVFTGVHIGDYEDWSHVVSASAAAQNGGVGLAEARAMGLRPRKLEDLLENILLRTKIARIRLSSLEPVEVTERLLDLYADPRMCPHFHMSIQSAEDRVLSGMRRQYSAADVESALNRIAARVPGAFVGMDVIVGFPGETEEQFAETFARLSQLPWTRLHVFPYSQRPGTKAAVFDGQVANGVIHARARRLRELSHIRFLEEARRQIGTQKDVLLLNQKKGLQAGERAGLSRDYWPIVMTDESASDSLNGAAATVNPPPHAVREASDECPVRIVGLIEHENLFQTRLRAVRRNESILHDTTQTQMIF